jgi:RNA ligase (TIGR02306 family)
MKWKVSKTIIRLFEHPNADKLEVGRVGDYQVVVQKGAYRDGDVVVFAPEKSVLSGPIRDEFAKYLHGPEQDRVGQARLRGEISCGVIIPPHLLPDLSSYDVDQDVSALLGITKYKPQIPEELLGAVEECVVESYAEHEVYQLGSYRSEFVDGERVVATEKINGTQCACVLDRNGLYSVSSKGLLDEGLSFQDATDNIYTKVSRSMRVRDRLAALMSAYPDALSVQVFMEAYPCNKGYGYGRTKADPHGAVFRVVVMWNDRKTELQHDHPDNPFVADWVPVLYDGPFDAACRVAIDSARKGAEQLSGRSLHGKEGLVIRPYDGRRASDGRFLIVKHINPDYRETGDELS